MYNEHNRSNCKHSTHYWHSISVFGLTAAGSLSSLVILDFSFDFLVFWGDFSVDLSVFMNELVECELFVDEILLSDFSWTASEN